MDPGSQEGVRVVAIREIHDGIAYVFGFGTYKGHRYPDGWPEELLKIGVGNPMIELDDGTIVWGMQCWWRACENDDALRKQYPDLASIVMVPVEPVIPELADVLP